MTAKVISLCEYRKSRDAEKRSKNENALDTARLIGWGDAPEFFGLRGLTEYPPETIINLDNDDGE